MTPFPGLTLAAAAAVGCAFGDSHHRRPGSAAATCCDTCGVATTRVAHLIQTLQCHPRWRTRDNAAVELRGFDWRCHPEILDALTTAMLTDCEEEVREEAAESLARIRPAPCVGDVHAALRRAAACDEDHATRKWARRALARLDDGCRDDCGICEPGGAVVVESEPPLMVPARPRRPAVYEVPALPPMTGEAPVGASGYATPIPPQPSIPSGPAVEDLPPPPAEALPFDNDEPPLVLPGTARANPTDRLAARDRAAQKTASDEEYRPIPRRRVGLGLFRRGR